MSKLPTLLLPKKPKDYREAGAYLLTVPDKFHKERHSFRGEDGKEYLLWTPASHSNDERRKHPSIGQVAEGYGDVDFKPGDTVVCEHHTFRRLGNEYDVFYEKDGIEYYRALNWQVFFKVDENQDLVPRKHILLCEPLKEKMVDTFLHIPEEYINYRRDVVRVVRPWDGCESYKEGDLLLIRKNADYPVDWKGKRFVKVDTASGYEVEAIVGSSDWRYTKVHKHVNHTLKHQR